MFIKKKVLTHTVDDYSTISLGVHAVCLQSPTQAQPAMDCKKSISAARHTHREDKAEFGSYQQKQAGGPHLYPLSSVGMFERCERQLEKAEAKAGPQAARAAGWLASPSTNIC